MKAEKKFEALIFILFINEYFMELGFGKYLDQGEKALDVEAEFKKLLLVEENKNKKSDETNELNSYLIGLISTINFF